MTIIGFIGLNSCGGGGDDGMLLFLPPGGGDSSEESTAGGPGTSPEDSAEDDENADNDDEEVKTEVIEPDGKKSNTDDTAENTTDTTDNDADNTDNDNDNDSSTNDNSGEENTTTVDDDSSVDISDTEDLDEDRYNEDIDEDDNPQDDIADDSDSSAKCVKSIKIITKKGRWYKSKDQQDAEVSGVHTFWRNEALKVRIKINKKCKHQKWAKLTVIARNIKGPLPSWYKDFNVEVRRGKKKKVIGAMKISASDFKYHEGSLYVRVRKNNTFWLYWTNDAWSRGKYDANINIKTVKLELLKNKVKDRTPLALNANKNCFTRGRFFFEKQTARTYWKNQIIGYCFNDLKPGVYEIKVRAKNYGSTGLPPGYDEFNVSVAADGVSDKMAIDASDEKYKTGSALLDLRGGDTIINLMWTNDKWKKGVYDANIMYRKIQLKRVGESERVGLTAYVGQHSNSIVILLSLIIALAALGAIMAYRKKMETMA